MPADLFCRLGDGHCYSTVDYIWQTSIIKIELDDDRKSKKLHWRFQLVAACYYKNRHPFLQLLDDRVSRNLWAYGPCQVYRGIYLDIIFVSHKDAEDHQQNPRWLLFRLQDGGFRCRKEKYEFVKPLVEYLGYPQTSIIKGHKVEAFQKVSTENLPKLRAFLGAWWYSILCNIFARPECSLWATPSIDTKKGVIWKLRAEKQELTFQTLNNLLRPEMVLVHFNPSSLTIGISCDASKVGQTLIVVWNLKNYTRVCFDTTLYYILVASVINLCEKFWKIIDINARS